MSLTLVYTGLIRGVRRTGLRREGKFNCLRRYTELSKGLQEKHALQKSSRSTGEWQECIKPPCSNTRKVTRGHRQEGEKLGQKTSSQGNLEGKEKEKNMQLAKTGKDRNVSKPFMVYKNRNLLKGTGK